MSSDRILRTKQIADVLGCSTKTVLRYWRDGKLPRAYKFGNSTSPIKMKEGDLQKLVRKMGRR